LKPARRLADLKPSPIRVISEGAPADAISLGLGEPTWDLPEPARRALAGDSGSCRYGPNAGLPELREAIARFHTASTEEVLVTTGSQGALFALTQAFVDLGDEVLVPDPGFVAYPALVRLAGGVPVPYRLAAEDGFRLRADAPLRVLDQHPRTRMVILNHPANPTGAGVEPRELLAVAAACRDRGLLLVSDEVYRDLYLGSAGRGPSLRDVSDDGVVVSSVSKAFGAPGLRVGWAVGDPAWLAPARIVHGYAATAAARPAQIAALALLGSADKVFDGARRQLSVRWQALVEAWGEHMDGAIDPPDAGFYHWMRLPRDPEIVADPMAFCLRLRDEAKVVVVPGITFGERGREYIRLSFAAAPAEIAEGVRRLAPFWKQT
jgi:aspartate/methionine/tyrosine aminotransferase